MLQISLRRHWNDGECRGNYPKIVLIQVGELS